MMSGNGYAMVWGMWLLMAIGTVGFWSLVAIVVSGLMRGPVRQNLAGPYPLRVPNERLVTKHMDAEGYEYRRRLIVDGHSLDQPPKTSNSEATTGM